MSSTPVIVAAMTRQRVIGHRGTIPWDLPLDRQLFRQLTWGHCVIMGRRTFQSLPAPLPGRTNLVLSRSTNHLPGCQILPNLPAALQRAEELAAIPFVIGGTEPFRDALPLAGELVISWVAKDYPGDRYFPPFDPTGWVLVKQEAYNGFTRCFYHRVKTAEPRTP